MNEIDGQPWGMCAAFGCPLLGSMGSDGRWYCFAHVNKPSGMNDAITAKLRGPLASVVETTLDIRRCGASFHDSPGLYRAIQRRLLEANRRDLLLGANGADRSPHVSNGAPIVKQWLARLESFIETACAEVGGAKLAHSNVPTAPVIGPTHAMGYSPYANGDDDKGESA
jgi:hypothetical protein